jgi:pyruvate dehydrogenase E1 component beta subunit
MAKITMREAISQALWEEMERDELVFLIGEEIGVWGGTYAVTKGFYDHFGGRRVRDTPISESVIVGAAIGSALTGLRPVAELMTINFAFSAMDHIVNEAAKLHYMFGGQFKMSLVTVHPAVAAASWVPLTPKHPMLCLPIFLASSGCSGDT